MKTTIACFATVTLLSAAPVTFASLIYINPTSVTSSSTGDFRSANNLANGIGLDASFTHDFGNSISPSYDSSWVTADPAPGGGDYFVDAGPVTLTIDLGSDTSFHTFVTWAYGGTTGNGSTKQGNNVRDFTLRFATEAEGLGGFGNSIALNPSFAQPDAAIHDNLMVTLRSDPALYSLGTSLTARYIEMTVTDNFFGQAGYAGGDRVGLGAIAVAVPEPSSGLLFALAGLGLMLRRRA